MTDSVRIAFAVAVAENGVIGAGGDLPWRLPTDLKRFRSALATNRARFVNTLTEKLLTYALGRAMRIEDDAIVNQITATFEADAISAR